MGEFLMQSLQYSGPFNPVLIGQSNDGQSKKNDKNQEYLSKSKVKMAQDNHLKHPQDLAAMTTASQPMILPSSSVHQFAKSVLKSMERQPSVYSSRGRYKSKSRLNEENPESSQIDFHRFNEDLEEMVQYRERDINVKKNLTRLQSARQTSRAPLKTREQVPQAYQEITKFMEQVAPQGPNPVQQSLILLSKCSLKMNLSQEQQKIAQSITVAHPPSPKKPARQMQQTKSRLSVSQQHSPSVLKNSKEQANRASKVALNRTSGSSVFKLGTQRSTAQIKPQPSTPMKANLSPYQTKPIEKAKTSQGPRVQGKYNIKAPQDQQFQDMFNTQSKLQREASAMKRESAAKYSTIAQTLASSKLLPRSPRTPASNQTGQNVRLLGRTTRATLASGPVTPGNARKPALALQTPTSQTTSPRSFPASSANPNIYLGKNPTSQPRASAQQTPQNSKLLSPGRLQNIHILRPSHIAMTTQAQLSRPKLPVFSSAHLHPHSFMHQNTQHLLQASKVSGGAPTPKDSTQHAASALKEGTMQQQSLDQGSLLMRSKQSESSLHRGMIVGSTFVGPMKIQKRYQLR